LIGGGDVTHVNGRLLEASSALVGKGVPLAEALAAGDAARARMDGRADPFVRSAHAYVLPGADTAEAVARLRPLPTHMIEAELALAMDRRLREKDHSSG
jgi:hypothetical protein